jgi:hypothetical protein
VCFSDISVFCPSPSFNDKVRHIAVGEGGGKGDQQHFAVERVCVQGVKIQSNTNNNNKDNDVTAERLCNEIKLNKVKKRKQGKQDVGRFPSTLPTSQDERGGGGGRTDKKERDAVG